jgi:hypothetical protein
MEKITDKNTIRPQNKNLKPAWKKGEPSPNPKGHPKGQRNYETIRREAIISIGKANGKTPEEIEEMLIAKGVSEALKGDFRFYKDDLDRVHGQATQKIDANVKYEKLEEIQKATKEILNGTD